MLVPVVVTKIPVGHLIHKLTHSEACQKKLVREVIKGLVRMKTYDGWKSYSSFRYFRICFLL